MFNIVNWAYTYYYCILVCGFSVSCIGLLCVYKKILVVRDGRIGLVQKTIFSKNTQIWTPLSVLTGEVLLIFGCFNCIILLFLFSKSFLLRYYIVTELLFFCGFLAFSLIVRFNAFERITKFQQLRLKVQALRSLFIYFYFNIFASLLIISGILLFHFLYPGVNFNFEQLTFTSLLKVQDYYGGIGKLYWVGLNFCRLFCLNCGFLIKIGFFVFSFWIVLSYRLFDFFSLSFILILIKLGYCILYLKLFYVCGWLHVLNLWPLFLRINYIIYGITFCLSARFLVRQKLLNIFFILSSMSRLSLIFLICLCNTPFMFFLGNVFLGVYLIYMFIFLNLLIFYKLQIGALGQKYNLIYLTDLSFLKQIFLKTSGKRGYNFLKFLFRLCLANLLTIPFTGFFRIKVLACYFFWSHKFFRIFFILLGQLILSQLYYFWVLKYSLLINFWDVKFSSGRVGGSDTATPGFLLLSFFRSAWFYKYFFLGSELQTYTNFWFYFNYSGRGGWDILKIYGYYSLYFLISFQNILFPVLVCRYLV